jgi:hypothetical protein
MRCRLVTLRSALIEWVHFGNERQGLISPLFEQCLAIEERAANTGEVANEARERESSQHEEKESKEEE